MKKSINCAGCQFIEVNELNLPCFQCKRIHENADYFKQEPQRIWVNVCPAGSIDDAVHYTKEGAIGSRVGTSCQTKEFVEVIK